MPWPTFVAFCELRPNLLEWIGSAAKVVKIKTARKLTFVVSFSTNIFLVKMKLRKL